MSTRAAHGPARMGFEILFDLLQACPKVLVRPTEDRFLPVRPRLHDPPAVAGCGVSYLDDVKATLASLVKQRRKLLIVGHHRRPLPVGFGKSGVTELFTRGSRSRDADASWRPASRETRRVAPRGASRCQVTPRPREKNRLRRAGLPRKTRPISRRQRRPARFPCFLV